MRYEEEMLYSEGAWWGTARGCPEKLLMAQSWNCSNCRLNGAWNNLVKWKVPGHGKGTLEQDDLLRSLPNQSTSWFYGCWEVEIMWNLLRIVVLPWEFREKQYKNTSLRTIGSHGSCFVREQGRSNLKRVKSSLFLLLIHMHKALSKGIHFCLFCVVSSGSELSRTESKSGYLVSDFMISF